MKNKRKRIYLVVAVILAMTISILLSACGEKKTLNDSGTTTMRHISFGTGEKTMIIVPGLSLGYVTDNAEGIEKAFSEFADEYTVYLFDVKDNVPENYTISDMGEDLAKEIKALGLKNLYMYGCSLGGMQCIYIAATYPELVEKIVLASSSCKANETSNAVIQNWIDLATPETCHELTDNMGQLIYSQKVYEAQKEAFAKMADQATPESLTRFANTAEAIIDLDLEKEAEAIKCPVLVLGAKGDKVLTAEGSTQIAEITGGEMYLYGDEYPHAVYDEAPDFKERVKAFFDK